MKKFLSLLALLFLGAAMSQTVYAQANCSLSGPTAINNGQNRTYSASAQSGASYFWSVTGPLTIIGGNTSSSVTVRGTGSGTGQVCYVRYRAGSLPCAVCKSVTVPTAGCPATLRFLGTVPECLGLGNFFSVTFNGNTSYTNYNWSVSGGSASIAQNGGSSVTVFASGSFTISVTARCNGQLISGSRGVNGINCNDIIFPEVRVSPNPTAENVSIEVKNPKATNTSYNIEVLSSIGKKELSKTVKGNQTIDVSSLKKGIYYLRVYKNGKLIGIEKMIKK